MTADAAVGAGIATVTVNAIAGLGISEGSGTKATGATGLDFVGPLMGVDASSNTGISTVRVDALTIKDEGSTVGTAGSITINFVGAVTLLLFQVILQLLHLLVCTNADVVTADCFGMIINISTGILHL